MFTFNGFLRLILMAAHFGISAWDLGFRITRSTVRPLALQWALCGKVWALGLRFGISPWGRVGGSNSPKTLRPE